MWYWCHLGVFFVLSLMVCLRGFYKHTHFCAAGYGFSIAMIGAAMTFFSWYGIYPSAGIAHYIQFALFMVYGLRIAIFMLTQEKKDSAEQEPDEAKKPNVFVKIIMWLLLCVFYVALTTGVAFRLFNAWGTTTMQWIGIAVSALGLLVEVIGDHSKRAKLAKDPDVRKTAPLYGIVRYPNYFGKILFWIGVMVSSLDALWGLGQWVTIALTFVTLIVMAIVGARMEKRQAEPEATEN